MLYHFFFVYHNYPDAYLSKTTNPHLTDTASVLWGVVNLMYIYSPHGLQGYPLPALIFGMHTVSLQSNTLFSHVGDTNTNS